MANPSFGGGLALQAKIPRDQFAMAERAMASKRKNEFAQAQAKTKKAAADDKAAMDWGKIAKVDYSKIHALDKAKATEIGGQIGKIIEEERNSGNPNWQNGLMLKLQPLVQQVGELNVRKQQFDKMTQQMASDEAAGNTYPEAIDYRKKIEAGDVSGVKDFKDRYGNISTTVNNEGLVVPSASRLTKEDIDAEVKKEMNTDYNRSFLGRVMEAQIDPAVKQYLIQNGLPKNKKDAQDIANSIGWTGQLPTTLEDIVKNKQTNLGSRRGFIRQMGDVLEKDYPEFFDDKTTQDRKEEILTEAGLKRYANLSGIKSIEKSVRREKPTESDKIMAKQAGSIQENVPIKFYHNKKENTWNAEMFMGINTPVLNVSNADGTWDMQNNKKLTGADPSFKFEPTGIAGGEFLTAGIGSAKKKGLVVTGTKLQYDPKEYKLAEAELIKAKLIKGDGGPDILDGDGNVVKHSEEKRENIIMAKMEQDGKVQRTSVAVPLKSLKGTLEGKKINVAAAEKKWEEMNKGGAPRGTSKAKDFTKLPLDKKKALQVQSGVKTRAEFEKWLTDNGYSF
jgi:hypothetical protein